MSLILEVNKVKYEGFLDAYAEISMDTIFGSFSFSATSETGKNFPIRNGSSVKILVNDIPVITGYAERLEVNYDSDRHFIRISGRDKTADLVDSTLYDSLELNTPLSLQRVIQTVLSRLGITDIKVINNAGAIRLFETSELISGSAENNAFEFIERYARKRQVLLSTDGLGNIVLNRASKDLLPIVLQNIAGDNNNNIFSAIVRYDTMNRFNKIKVYSQDNYSVTEADPNSDSVNRKGISTDNEIRAGRRRAVISEFSGDDFTNRDRAIWEVNIRRARGFVYEAIIPGFNINETSKDIWTPNKLIKVQDDFCDVSSQLLIRKVKYQLDESNGEITTLTMSPRDAYTLQANLDQFREKYDETGNELNVQGYN